MRTDVIPEVCVAGLRLGPWLYRDRRPWRGFTEDDMRRWERRLLD